MTRKLKRGGYTAVLSLIVTAAVIVFNMMVQELPETVRKWDLSGEKLYTLGETTKEVLDGLDKDVTIYVVADPTLTDERITGIVNRYGDASSHIRVETVDPVLHPERLGELEAENNTLLISCEATGKRETVAFGDIIQYDQMAYLYYQQLVESEFDGEGQITSAISRVTSDADKKICETQGHGEAELSQTVLELLEKSNMTAESANLLTENGIPEDCDLLILNNPETDLADDEKTMILDYLNGGGRAMILAGYSETERPNLEAVMNTFGIRTQEGLAADTERFYQNNPYFIFPEYGSSEIVSGIDQSLSALVIQSGALAEKEEKDEGVEVETFLTTSEAGVLVTADGQSDAGRYPLAMAASKTIDEETEGRLVVIAAPNLISDYITQSFTNLSNLDIFLNAVTWNFDDVTNISIPAKSLEEPYNMVTGGGGWALLFILVIPLVTLGGGFAIWMTRRKL